MAFGTSCAEHSATEGPALVVQIARDPGGTTPEKTGKLCPASNSRTDVSAAHGFDLWCAAISMKPPAHPYEDAILKKTHFTNAVLHGVPTKGSRSERVTESLEQLRERAMRSCARLLHDELVLLQPRVIIVIGEIAGLAMNNIAPGPWSEASPEAPPHRRVVLPGAPHGALALKVIHGSANGTNRTAAPLARRYFATAEEQQRFVRNRIETLPSPHQALQFLSKYRSKPSSTDTVYRGMMLHLAWWIHIGTIIRSAQRERRLA